MTLPLSNVSQFSVLAHTFICSMVLAADSDSLNCRVGFTIAFRMVSAPLGSRDAMSSANEYRYCRPSDMQRGACSHGCM